MKSRSLSCQSDNTWDVLVHLFIYFCFRRSTRTNRKTASPKGPEMRMPGTSWQTRPPGGCGCLWGRRWRWCSVSTALHCTVFKSFRLSVKHSYGHISPKKENKVHPWLFFACCTFVKKSVINSTVLNMCIYTCMWSRVANSWSFRYRTSQKALIPRTPQVTDHTSSQVLAPPSELSQVILK